MFLTQWDDYNPKISAVYQSYAWHAATLSLQQSLFLVLIHNDPEQDDVAFTETRILSSPGDVLALIEECGIGLIGLETTVLCPRWISKDSAPWKSYILNSIWEAVADDGPSAGWRYDAISGEQIYEIYGSENPETLAWKKVA